MLSNTRFRLVTQVLYGFFCLSSVICLAISIWITPYYNTPRNTEISHQMLEFGIEAGVYCWLLLLLLLLQLITGFYLAVRTFKAPVRWKFLLLAVLFATSVFGANAAFGVIGPFLDSWD